MSILQAPRLAVASLAAFAGMSTVDAAVLPTTLPVEMTTSLDFYIWEDGRSIYLLKVFNG